MFIKVNRIGVQDKLELHFVAVGKITGIRQIPETLSRKAYSVLGSDDGAIEVAETPEQIEELVLQAKIKEQRALMIAGRDYFTQELARAEAEKAAEQPQATAASARKQQRPRTARRVS